MPYSIRKSTADEGDLLVSIWRSSVAETHSFVSSSDLAAIDSEVQGFLPSLSAWLAVDDTGRAAGFMILTDGVVESLFIAGDEQGRGAGRALIDYAKLRASSLMTVVNEQNERAVGFYRKLGFIIVGHSPTDDAGRPYPILHLRWDR